MGLSAKLETVVIGALIVSIIVCYVVFAVRINKANAEVARHKADAAIWESRFVRVAAELETQNAAIERVRVDTVYALQLVKEAAKKYVEIRTEVIESIQKDSSDGNKISNIDNVLRRFYGGGGVQ